MKRFAAGKRRFGLLRSFLAPVAGFLLVFILFFWGISSISGTTEAEQRKSLEEAVRRSAVHCYAVEGSYPESLSYLKEHYGLTYDSKKFFVDYHAEGSNLMPDITVIRLS